MRKCLFMGWLTVMFLMLAGCSSRTAPESFTREDVDTAFVQNIAVLPYQNNSSNKYAPILARDITITQVLAMGLYNVVEKDLVDNFMYNEAIDSGVPIDPLTLKRMGNRLNVQAFLMGTVDVAGMSKLGSTTYPEVALTLRLIEAESGMILWQASGYNSGESFGRRLLGIKPDDAYKLTFDLVRKLLNTTPLP
jgi:TolB-like protein